MGFSDDWTKRVMSCIISVNYLFKFNERIIGSFNPSRGLRQGGPLSPKLSIICADAFSSTLARAVSHKSISGVRVCNGAQVFPTCFLPMTSYC